MPSTVQSPAGVTGDCTATQRQHSPAGVLAAGSRRFLTDPSTPDGRSTDAQIHACLRLRLVNRGVSPSTHGPWRKETTIANPWMSLLLSDPPSVAHNRCGALEHACCGTLHHGRAFSMLYCRRDHFLCPRQCTMPPYKNLPHMLRRWLTFEPIGRCQHACFRPASRLPPDSCISTAREALPLSQAFIYISECDIPG